MAGSIITEQNINKKIWDAARNMRLNPTPQEKRLWGRLRAGRLGGLHFRRQQIIDRYVVDFYNHSAGLIIELDGSVHDDPEQMEYDRVRQIALEEKGLKVIRFRNKDIDQHLHDVLEKIKFECRKENPQGF